MHSWAKTLVGFMLAFLVLVGVAVLTYANSNKYLANSKLVTHNNAVKQLLTDLVALIVDLETAERGYVITGEARFLRAGDTNPNLVREALTNIRLLTLDNDTQQEHLEVLEPLVQQKLEVIAELIRLRRESGQQEAIAAVASGRGETLMTTIHRRIDTMRALEDSLLIVREQEVLHNSRTERTMLIVGVGLQATMLGLVFLLIVRDRRNREQNAATLQRTLSVQRAILDSANAAIIACDVNGLIHMLNPAVERWLGYQPDELLGRTPQRLHLRSEVELRAQELNVELGRPIAPGFDVFITKARDGQAEEREWTYVRKDGSHLPVSLSVSVLRDEAGIATGFMSIAHDLTLRKQAEQQILCAKEAAEAATKSKSEFLACMSHEIRTPMNGVIGMTGLLLDTLLSEAQRAMAETVRTSADSLLTIINDILDFSKIEAGKLDLETTKFDLRHVVEDAIGLLAEKAYAKGLELACAIAPEVPIAVSGDPGRLRQVLVNLLSNAVKFTEHGEVVVRVSLVSENTSGLRRAIQGDAIERDRGNLLPVDLAFEVMDTGIGIPPAVQARLFQPFTQADASTTRTFGGTGLGLAICKRLVELMGGEIGILSAPGAGSTFRFTLKLIPGVAAKPRRTISLKGILALVIDDNATNRTILQQQLIGWGMDCDVASDAPTGLRLLRASAQTSRSYAVVVMDMQMPGMDGLALSQIIKDDRDLADARLVLLSSMMISDLSVRAQAIGIDACITKPVRQYQLRTLLLKLISGDELTPAIGQPLLAASLRGRVLVAEDNPVNQRLAIAMLGKLGCRCDTVANGQEAVTASELVPYDVVVMDCQMPEMDGYQATAAIRRRELADPAHKHLPIIAMTANAMAGDRQQCLDAGMDDYISKPVRIEHLAAALARWLPTAETPVTPPPATVVSEARLALFDPSELALLQEQLGDDHDSIPAIIGIFLTESPLHLATIAAAVSSHDADALRKTAHRLKGSCQILGARTPAELCHQLESCGQRGDLAPSQALLDSLANAMTGTLELLEQERQRLTA